VHEKGSIVTMQPEQSKGPEMVLKMVPKWSISGLKVCRTTRWYYTGGGLAPNGGKALEHAPLLLSTKAERGSGGEQAQGLFTRPDNMVKGAIAEAAILYLLRCFGATLSPPAFCTWLKRLTTKQASEG
jgi:hypothetical protein